MFHKSQIYFTKTINIFCKEYEILIKYLRVYLINAKHLRFDWLKQSAWLVKRKKARQDNILICTNLRHICNDNNDNSFIYSR